MIAFRALVNNLFLENFDIIFMGNEKSCKNNNKFFFFSIKTFFNWIVNQCPKDTRLHDPLLNSYSQKF